MFWLSMLRSICLNGIMPIHQLAGPFHCTVDVYHSRVCVSSPATIRLKRLLLYRKQQFHILMQKNPWNPVSLAMTIIQLRKMYIYIVPSEQIITCIYPFFFMFQKKNHAWAIFSQPILHWVSGKYVNKRMAFKVQHGGICIFFIMYFFKFTFCCCVARLLEGNLKKSINN